MWWWCGDEGELDDDELEPSRGGEVEEASWDCRPAKEILTSGGRSDGFLRIYKGLSESTTLIFEGLC